MADPPVEPVVDPVNDVTDAVLGAALRSIAPTSVVTACRRIDDADIDLLQPDEAVAVERAVQKRRREFATGRALLHALIGTSAAIPMGTNRAPVLPPGVAASLAHDHRHAVAVVALTPDVAVGIDIEPITRLADDVARLVLRPDEAGIDAHLAFTLKEAAYKAWSNCGGRLLDHHEVRLSVGRATFTAEVVDDAVQLVGTYARAADRWLALVVVPRWA